MTGYNDYFCGNEVSQYAKEHGYVDYATLSKAFDAVLNNDIMEKTYDIGYWEQVSGTVDNQDEIDEKQEQLDELQEKIDELQEQIDNNDCDIDSMKEEQKDDSYIDNHADIDSLKEENSKLTKEKQDLEEQAEKLEKEIDDLQQEQDYPPDVYQWYIVSDNGADILQRVNEIVYYNEELDMYLWGVTHFGTSWTYVLTDIPIEYSEDYKKDNK